jgi:hypothetical protein
MDAARDKKKHQHDVGVFFFLSALDPRARADHPPHERLMVGFCVPSENLFF